MKRFLQILSITTLLIGSTIKAADALSNDFSNASSRKLNGSVKKIIEASYSASGKEGEIVIKKQIEHTTTEYNSDGEMVKRGGYNQHGVLHKYEYSSGGQSIKTVSSSGGGNTYFTVSKYNSAGDLMTKVNHKDGKIYWAQRYEYKYSDGKLVTEESFNTEGELPETSDGKLIKEDPYDIDAMFYTITSIFDEGVKFCTTSRYEYKYSEGKLVTRESFDRDGELSRTVEYEYNSDGELMTEEHIVPYSLDPLDPSDPEPGLEPTSTVVDRYEYDSDGKSVMRRDYINDGLDMCTVEYEYNIDGELVKTTSLFTVEHVSEYKYTKFDSKKNWSERIEFENGEVSGVTIREMTYHKIKPANNFNGAKITDSIYSASRTTGGIVVGELIGYEEYKYSSDGQLYSKVDYTDLNNEEGFSPTIYEYEYSDGKLITESWSDDHGGDYTNYEYNSDGQLVRSAYKQFNGEDIVTTYEYNSDGKSVTRVRERKYEGYEVGEIEKDIIDKEDIKDEIGSVVYFFISKDGKYEYTKFDHKKNWIERIAFKDGKVDYLTKREIIYHE